MSYLAAGDCDRRLDIYTRRDSFGPQQTVLFIHGGFWVSGSKEHSVMSLVPWFRMGCNVVNVEYRRTTGAPAPAAADDCLAALRFIVDGAKTYHVDTGRLTIAGESAGGHLALLTAMNPKAPAVAAVVNFCGITDVVDLVGGPNRAESAVQWIGPVSNPADLARELSPLRHVRAGLPPILSIHGDADDTVPYDHARRLHEALAAAGVPNQLLTIPAAGHGNFTRSQRRLIFRTVRHFLQGMSILTD